jgi:hypothetical protein
MVIILYIGNHREVRSENLHGLCISQHVSQISSKVIFSPKFHCELNFIEHAWCSCKWYAREHCEYSLESLRRIQPEALKSVSSVTINRYYRRCMRILNAYDSGFHYGTKTFKDHVYKSHRIVKSKW